MINPAKNLIQQGISRFKGIFSHKETAKFLEAEIEQLCQKIPGFKDGMDIQQGAFIHWSCLPEGSYIGKDILDLGCGVGSAAALFLQRGANFVWGIDPVLTAEQIQTLKLLPKSRFTSNVLLPEIFDAQQFDLVYAHFVTEHIIDLPGTFATIFQLLRPGGRFVALHHNYYSPTGSHDFAFIEREPTSPQTFRPKGPICWESPQKCDVSQEFRLFAAKHHDASVGEWVLTPEDCSGCPYFCRSQMWAHLLYQNEFNELYKGAFWRTNAQGSLNKVTLFQLKQILIETGFQINHWQPTITENPPPTKLQKCLSYEDLQTDCLLFAVDKP